MRLKLVIRLNFEIEYLFNKYYLINLVSKTPLSFILNIACFHEKESKSDQLSNIIFLGKLSSSYRYNSKVIILNTMIVGSNIRP